MGSAALTKRPPNRVLKDVCLPHLINIGLTTDNKVSQKSVNWQVTCVRRRLERRRWFLLKGSPPNLIRVSLALTNLTPESKQEKGYHVICFGVCRRSEKKRWFLKWEGRH
jgi:hypothetical protein